MENIVYRPIGIIRSPFKTPRDTPIQPTAAKGIRGTVEILPEYEEGLHSLEGFSHIILLFHCHLSSGYSLKVTPFMDTTERGVFATRAPRRPNSIGLSIVKLIERKNNILYIEDVDIIDGTPLLDIKPFVPQFDVRENVRIGWLERNVGKLKETKDDGRFTKGE